MNPTTYLIIEIIETYDKIIKEFGFLRFGEGKHLILH